MNRKKLKLLFQLMKIAQSDLRLCPDELAKNLNVHKRTLSRYIKDLQASGVPVYYDKDHKCYLMDHDFFLQPFNLNFNEALGLLLLIHRLRDQANTFFDNSALNALIKIETLLPIDLRQQCCESIDRTSTCLAHQAVVNLANEMNVNSSKIPSQQSKSIRIEEVRQASKKMKKVSKSATF